MRSDGEGDGDSRDPLGREDIGPRNKNPRMTRTGGIPKIRKILNLFCHKPNHWPRSNK